MNDSSDTMKKEEKLASKGQQNKDEVEMQGMSHELSKGAESERERSTKRPGTGA